MASYDNSRYTYAQVLMELDITSRIPILNTVWV